MVLPFDHTHDFDLVVSKSRFEIAWFEEWGVGVGGWVGWLTWNESDESIIHDHDRDLWVTMVAGWETSACQC